VVVEPTSSPPHYIHLPGLCVHRVIQGRHEKRIEQLTTHAAQGKTPHGFPTLSILPRPPREPPLKTMARSPGCTRWMLT
jgi:hypothetical protein